MDYMFQGSSFNQDISTWDVSNVTSMASMFRGNNSFNQKISSWDVSSVTNMSDMFNNVNSQTGTFNQDISSWSVNGVTNCDGFSINTPLTEANIPKFTNCIP